MSIFIRKAEPKDADGISEVLRHSIKNLCIVDHRNDIETIAQWVQNKTPENALLWISSPSHYCLVAEDNSEIAGVGLVTAIGEITLLYVSPDYRFMGVSSNILKKLEQHCSSIGLRRVFLSSSRTARLFYKTRGYQSTGEPTKEFSITLGFPMTKSLAPTL